MISRDAKRRIEVITKKIANLQELGVPCLFSYATTWTGGLFVVGDDRMTSIVKEQKDEFLGKLETEQSNCDASISTFLLPTLPQPISEMNGRTLSTMIVGIAKDLNIDWEKNQRGGQILFHFLIHGISHHSLKVFIVCNVAIIE